MSFQPISFIEPVNHINLASFMNTSTISPALNGVSPNAKQISPAPDAEIDDAKPRFSDIMKDLRASGKNASDAIHNGAHIKAGRSKASDEAKSASDADDATALLAISNGPTLPALALNIAAQAASSPLAKDADAEHAAKKILSPPALDAKAASIDQTPAPQAAIALVASSGRAMPESSDNIASPNPGAAPALNNSMGQADSMDQAAGKTDTANGPSGDKRIADWTQTAPTLKTGDKGGGDKALATAIPNAPALSSPHARNANDAPTETIAAPIFSVGSLAGSSMPTASTAASQGSAQTTNLGIGTPLQGAQWANDFARQFTTLVGHGATHTAELSLNPPDLGPLRVSISVSDNVAHAVFMSPHAAVRQAVENALPQLQQTLANAGISLGQASVSDQPNRQDSFDEVQPAKRKPSTSAIGGFGSAGGGLAAHPTSRGRTLEGLVDTFA